MSHAKVVDYCKFYHKSGPERADTAKAAPKIDVLSISGPFSSQFPTQKPGDYGHKANLVGRAPDSSNHLRSGFSAYQKGTEHHLREGAKAYMATAHNDITQSQSRSNSFIMPPKTQRLSELTGRTASGTSLMRPTAAAGRSLRS